MLFNKSVYDLIPHLYKTWIVSKQVPQSWQNINHCIGDSFTHDE